MAILFAAATGAENKPFKPTEQWKTTFNDKGHKKTERLASYVVLLTMIDHGDVFAWRVDECRNKEDAITKLAMRYANPEKYNVKGAWKLYDTDFQLTPDTINNLRDCLPDEKNRRRQERLEGNFK